jgi:flagellin-like hook-associated protein FlgL
MARASLAQSTDQTAIAMERLSTGIALGFAKDDPSAFYAGSTLGAQISWEAQAVQNISDASSLMNAADGAIEQVKTMLQRIRTLAMQAANSTAEMDRSALQAEVDQLTTEIDRLTNSSMYNGQRLLKGEQQYREFQVGSRGQDVVAHRFSGFESKEIGAYSYLSAGEGAFAAAATKCCEPPALAKSNSPGTTARLSSFSGQRMPVPLNWLKKLMNNRLQRVSRPRQRHRPHCFLVVRSRKSTACVSTRWPRVIFASAVMTLVMLVAAINKISGQTGVQAQEQEGQVVLTDRFGGDIVIENTRQRAGYDTLQVQKLVAQAGSVPEIGAAIGLGLDGELDTVLVSGAVELVSSEVFSLYNQSAVGHFADVQQGTIQEDTTISNRRGALSLVNGKLYQGDGDSAKVVALVDAGTTDMAAGSLDLNLAYEIDDLVSSSDPFRSWTKIQQRVVLDGQGTLNRHTVPKDLLLPSFANGTLSASGDAAYPEAEVSFDFQQISNARQPLELQSGPLDLPNVGIVHGPALQSADSYSLEAGDILSFDWRGMAGTGDYYVMTYIVDKSTGHSEILMNETGKGGASSNWTTVSKTIETPGDYHIVIVSGVRSDKEVTFQNGNFEDGSVGDTTIPGWQTYTQQLQLGGVDSVAGQPTPNDIVFPATVIGAAPHDGATPSAASYSAQLANNSPDGSGLSVQLQSKGVTIPGYDILHGPYLVSDDAVALKPGDSVSFDWQATGGSDAYDVLGYLVDEDTGEIQELLNETGATTSARTSWATVSSSIEKEGNYRFVFVAGTWDASGGTAAGANLYIDNVVVDASEQVVQADAALRIDEVTITKDSQNLDPDELAMLIDRVYGHEEDTGHSYDVQFVGNRIEITSDPIVADLKSVESIGIRTAAGANAALTIVDHALDYSANSQAELSAITRSVEFRLERLLDSSVQMESSKGRILDADFALESARLARQQMINQLAGFVLTNTNEILRSSLGMLLR